MYYINREGTAFSFTEGLTRTIYMHDSNNKESSDIFIYILDEQARKFHIESIENIDVAKMFISWLAYRIATDESFFCYEDFKELEGRLDAAKALKEHKGRLDTVKVPEVK